MAAAIQNNNICTTCGEDYRYIAGEESQCSYCLEIGTPMDDATCEVRIAGGVGNAKNFIGKTLDGAQVQNADTIYAVELTGEVTVTEGTHRNGRTVYTVSVPGRYQDHDYDKGATLFKGRDGIDSAEMAKAVIIAKLAAEHWAITES